MGKGGPGVAIGARRGFRRALRHDSRVAVGTLRVAHPTGCIFKFPGFNGSDPWGKVAADKL